MSSETIEARERNLRELEAKATPGPWRPTAGKGAATVTSDECAIYQNIRTVEVPECVERWQADARLIAALRNDALAIIDDLRAELARVTAERDQLREVAGLDRPWPLFDVIENLAMAAEHLLGDHACDSHGHEETRIVADEAWKYARALRSAVQGNDEEGAGR